ncbi:hypothetical protein Tco_0670806 [Tanacetum coccineum]
MLKKFGLEDSKPTNMPMFKEIKLTKNDKADSMDSTKYQDEIMPLSNQEDYKRTKVYKPRIHRSKHMDDDIRESYRTLKECLIHEGRFVTPSFIEQNNMPHFQAIGLESFLTLDEPICPRFVTEFYHSLEVKRSRDKSSKEVDLFLGKTIKDKGKRADPPSSSSSFSSSNENEETSFLEFYEELSDNEDLTDEKRRRDGCLSA